MYKVKNFKNSGQYSSGSEGTPLKRAHPESAHRFDKIWSRDRHRGGRERNMKDKDSLEDSDRGGTGNNAKEPVAKGGTWAGGRNRSEY